MDLRLALYALAARHRLDAQGMHQLEALAGLNREPAGLARWLPRGVAILAAALGGLGLIFWIAANWETLGRFGRFALLEGFFLAMCVGALFKPKARLPLGLLALLAIGGLFAYFGQTYQTGADPWQLFAVWAALALPLCLAMRSDVLWAPWALIAVTGISLWIHAHTAHTWRVTPQDARVYLLAWGAALLLVFALGPAARRVVGAGTWAMRTAVTLTVLMVSTTALAALFHKEVSLLYWLGLGLLGLGAGALSSRQFFEIFALSAVALGLNLLLVFGLGRALLEGAKSDGWIGALLMLGLLAAGLLAGTVQFLMHLSRRYADDGEPA